MLIARLFLLTLYAAFALEMMDAKGEPCALLKVGELPVTVTERNRVLVDGSVDGVPTHFSIDTGSNATLMDGVGIPEKSPNGENLTDRNFYEHIEVSKKRYDNINIAGNVMNGAYYFHSKKPFMERGIYGSIGNDFFGNFDYELDLSGGKIKLYKPSNCGERLAYWADRFNEADIIVLDGEVVVFVEINGVRVRAVLDTGFSRSVVSWDLTRRLGIRDDTPAIAKRTTENRNGIVERFSDIKIGDEIIKNSSIRIQEIPTLPFWLTVHDITDRDMILGVDFIKSHHIFIDTTAKKMYFTWGGGAIFTPPAKQ